MDIFDALASTPTIASAAKRTTTSSDKRSYQQLPPPPPPLSSAKPETTTTETPSKKQPSSSALPSRVPRLPARVPTQDGRIHLQSKDNEPTSIEDSRSRRSLTKEQQSLTKDNEKNDENQLNEQQRIPTDENVPPASSSSSIQHPMTTTDEDDRISLSLTDFNAIFNRVEDMRTQIAQMTSTETSKQQGVDKATAITPPKTITRPAGPNITAIEGRIQRARKAMRESLAITERWFQSTEQELSSSASLSYLPSRKLSQISKWRHDTADDFSDSLPARRQPYSTLHSDVDDTATTRSTSTHRSRTSRVCFTSTSLTMCPPFTHINDRDLSEWHPRIYVLNPPYPKALNLLLILDMHDHPIK